MTLAVIRFLGSNYRVIGGAGILAWMSDTTSQLLTTKRENFWKVIIKMSRRKQDVKITKY